jgi:3-hydroxymyristoyl/3-hydroxydecanoyl-(acyl carrier protein) dehydratase
MQAIPLQQTHPFRYVDEVLSLDVAARSARLKLALGERQQRFGGTGELPGYLLIEAMAQASGVLLRSITEGDNGGLLVGLAEATLPAAVPMPASLELAVSLKQAMPPFFNFDARVLDGTRQIAASEIQIMSRRDFT